MKEDLCQAGGSTSGEAVSPAALQPGVGADAGGLPDSIRAPLHELHADTDWLLHRANQEPDVIPLLAESMRGKCSQIETAVYSLLAENSRLREAREWQPIETAPKDGQKVLVGAFIEGEWGIGVCWYAEHHKQWLTQTWHDRPDVPPSHWMPLPEPPHPRVPDDRTVTPTDV